MLAKAVHTIGIDPHQPEFCGVDCEHVYLAQPCQWTCNVYGRNRFLKSKLDKRDIRRPLRCTRCKKAQKRFEELDK